MTKPEAVVGAGPGRPGGARRTILASLLLSAAGTLAVPAFAQPAGAAPSSATQLPAPPAAASAPADTPSSPAASPAPAAPLQSIRSISVVGNERLEPETVLSYVDLRAGDPYDREKLDRALKALYATELFTDVEIRNDGTGNLTIDIKENPVINRVIIEGAKRIKEDKIRGEIRVAPRQVFTRSRIRSDIDRILELYRRGGRFSARIEPKTVALDQNRVDLVFEINEGQKSKVRQINVLGNQRFSDKKLRGEMMTKQARWFRLFTSNDTYDPDRLAFDQQKLRQFYLTEGYADFRVVSSVAELTPDERDFLVTYVIDEGERYKFGNVDLESDIRDVKADTYKRLLPMKKGDWYNAKQIEDTVDGLTEAVGALGYAFADIRPNFDRDKDKREMGVTFVIQETPRVYVESVTINGNTRTRDDVIRREFRLTEGDAFNSLKVKRSRDRIQSLGFFQDKLEVKQEPGTSPDKVALQVDVEERPTGSLQLSAGYSSIERFIFSFAIEQRNFRGRAQQLSLSASISSYAKSIEAGFTEPYLLNRNMALGFNVFRRDYNSFTYDINGDRSTTYDQVTTGFQVRVGTALNEFWSAQLRYGLSFDNVTLDKNTFFSVNPDTGVLECDPLKAGRYLCDAIGRYTTSAIGYSLVKDSLDNRIRPTRGERLVLSQDLAGVGGTVHYVRSRINYDHYWALPANFILKVGGEAGNIFSLDGNEVRLTDRFFLGEPQMRGFGIRGLGPRIIRKYRQGLEEGYDDPVGETRDSWTDDALGGRNYYLGHVEMEIPLGSGGRELGIRPSLFMDVGGLWSSRFPALLNQPTQRQPQLNIDGTPVLDADGNPVYQLVPGFDEVAYGDSASPRVSVGIGVSWNSPMGPFRFDIAKVLRKVEGDDTQVFQFNMGTQF